MTARLLIGKLSGASEVLRAAKVSECGRYRYALTRHWGALGAPVALFVMLNPSTADGLRDDPTVRKCIGFARQWALGGIRIANLFALRATEPRELHAALRRGEDAVGPLNLEHVRALADGANRIVLAWGAHARGYPDHVARVVWALRRGPDCPTYCLGRTDEGMPRHPLMPPYSTPLELYQGTP